MKRWLIILLFFAASRQSGLAQSGSISFRNININEGLSQSSVVDIAADNTGFLWFATQDGLNRYDGKEFLIFKKTFDDITTASGSTTGRLAVGNRNDLWVITSGGKLERMNLYDQKFIHVEMLNGIQLPPVSCIYSDGDNLWIGTETQGLFIYKLSTRRLIHHADESSGVLPSDQIQEIFKDKTGRIWILTTNGITVFRDITKPDQSFLKADRANAKKMISCSSIAEDSQKTLWLGTYGKGLLIKRSRDSFFILSPDFMLRSCRKI